MAPRQTRAQRLAMPLAREVVRDVAVSHGGCVRPIQLRRTDTATGQVGQVMVPCGHTFASVCPSCAERNRVLRAARCKEGWHLDHEPVIEPDEPDDERRVWIELRARAQQDHDQAEAAGRDTADAQAVIGELDELITKARMRGNVLPERQTRRHRSTRRRQDTPDLPKRKMSPRTVGKTYTAPDGKTFRPSMFLTLTCPSYGRVQADGTPADPTACDYTRAARDALHFAALFDRFIQNLRRFAGYDVQYFAAVDRSGAWPLTSTSRSAARCRAPSCARSSPRPTTRVWWPPTATVRSEDGNLPVGMRPAAVTSTRPPASCCPPGMRRWMLSATMMSRCTWPGLAPGSTPRASSLAAATPPAHRLPHQVPDQTWMDERAQHLSNRTLRLIHQILERAIRHAQARDKVRRNVASLIDVPEGQEGRPSKSMTRDQAIRLLEEVGPGSTHRLAAYVALSLLTGVRTEKARALTWADVDLQAGTVAVYRSVRAKGDTKTRRSRRVIKLPTRATEALKEHRKRQAAEQLAAGDLWQDHGLVFAREDGIPLDRRQVRREFAVITRRPGWGRRGRRASCATRSSPSCPPAACRSSASATW